MTPDELKHMWRRQYSRMSHDERNTVTSIIRMGFEDHTAISFVAYHGIVGSLVVAAAYQIVMEEYYRLEGQL